MSKLYVLKNKKNGRYHTGRRSQKFDFDINFAKTYSKLSTAKSALHWFESRIIDFWSKPVVWEDFEPVIVEVEVQVKEVKEVD